MKKIVNIKDIIPGMYLSKVDGKWFEHPFWTKGFVLTDKSIALLLKSNVNEIWIDTSKGLDLSILNNESTPIDNEIKSNQDISQPLSDNDCKIIKKSYQEELKTAKQIIKNADFKVYSIFNDIRMGKAFNNNDAIALVDEISESIFRNSDAFISIVRLKNKDNYTYLHSIAVCALMISLSKTLGYNKEFCKKAGKAGLLHDVGKMFIPLEILNKPGKLTDIEYDIVKKHPEQGWNLLNQSPGIFSQETLEVCLHHHEKFDGSGYPHKLKEENISIISRMGAICDVYDAVTSDRPYKKGWEPTIAIKNMSQWNGHFDPKIFRAFVTSIGIYPIGSLVKMKSGKIGVVIERCESNILTPKVKVFFSTKSNLHIPPEIIDLSRSFKDKIESNDVDYQISHQELANMLSN